MNESYIDDRKWAQFVALVQAGYHVKRFPVGRVQPHTAVILSAEFAPVDRSAARTA